LLVRCRHRQAELLEHALRLRHLLGVGLGELAASEPQLSSRPTRTLPPITADIAAMNIWLRPAPSTDQ